MAGSFAAAGMLAPQSERLPAGPLLDVCLQSREMYGNWVKEVERGAREASLGVVGASRGGGRSRSKRSRSSSSSQRDCYTGVGAQYLWELVDEDGIVHSFDDGPSPPLEPWETGFHGTGGFLAPAFAGDAVATWSPQPQSGQAMWLDEIQVRELEPMLHPSVIGGWWFPEDASVDARRLTCSLRAACAGLGVQMNFGPEYEVKSLEMGVKGGSSYSDEDKDCVSGSTATTTRMSTCRGVHLANGQIYAPKSLIVANGSWMRNLLPLPVVPHKGQSISLRMPSSSSSSPILSRVLFAQDTYIVPKADGRIIVGATVEPGRFDGDVTPSGMLHCLSEATRLVPALSELPIEECWAGLRPTTPDKCPILGGTEQWDNVYLAGGYWRNGVLLAPKTGQLIGDLVMNDGNLEKLSTGDRDLLKAFAWERFTSPGGGKALAANARYAATFYPVHKRSTTGVAASVGTELGFYEGASAAKGDRQRDRDALLFGALEGRGGDGNGSGEDALERAAMMGVDDARAFTLGDDGDGWMVRRKQQHNDDGIKKEFAEEDVTLAETTAVEVDHPDAFTVGLIEDTDFETKESVVASDLSSIYAKIKANKLKASESIQMEEAVAEERPDPGFRIYHVDSVTRELMEVPPFTSPGEFFQMKAEGKLSSSKVEDHAIQPSMDAEGSQPLSGGYTAIREAYGEGSTVEATAEYTRRARMNNRIETSEIDESKIGAIFMDRIKPNKSLANKVGDHTLAVDRQPVIDVEPGAIDTGAESHVIDDGSDEKTYDGYQDIQQANSASSREEELRLMKEARQANRAKSQL